jgi:hypothetical protein
MYINKYIRLLLFIVMMNIISFANADINSNKVKWCLVNNNTGKIFYCYNNKIQCNIVLKNNDNYYSCVAK